MATRVRKLSPFTLPEGILQGHPCHSVPFGLAEIDYRCLPLPAPASATPSPGDDLGVVPKKPTVQISMTVTSPGQQLVEMPMSWTGSLEPGA